MDIQVYFKEKGVTIPYDYGKKHHGLISHLMNNQNYKSSKNNYLYSYLIGGVRTHTGIYFKDNPYFNIRVNNERDFQEFLKNFEDCRQAYCHLTLDKFCFFKVDSDKSIFKADKCSPILLPYKRFPFKGVLPKESIEFAEKYMMDNSIRNAEEKGRKLGEFSIHILGEERPSDIKYDGKNNKGRCFTLKIEGSKEDKEFILNNGIGKSCGIGFGLLI